MISIFGRGNKRIKKIKNKNKNQVEKMKAVLLL